MEDRDNQLAQAMDSIEKHDSDAEAYIACAGVLDRFRKLEEALGVLRSAETRVLPSPALHALHIDLLTKGNRTGEAIALAAEAAHLFPEHRLLFRLREAITLPIFYDKQEDVDYHRARYEAGLRSIDGEFSLDTSNARQQGLAAIRRHVNFYLGYQNRNDRELQMIYGKLVHRVVSANYPELMKPPPMPPLPTGSRLRIGYASNYFHDHSVTKLFLGWLSGHDPARFAVFTYHVGKGDDPVVEQVQRASFRFRRLPKSVAETAAAIRADKLHILVFLDIGMSPFMNLLATLGLAPIQCASWSHPVTSGLPTVRYFISADLMEPGNAQSHYSEDLIRLPGIGVCYSKPVIPEPLLRMTRRDFGLREDAIVYLSCQAIFKYLPEQDALFARIARRVPNSQFVFLAMNEMVRKDFERRMARSFEAEGLHAEAHCLALLSVRHLDYLSLIRNSDIVLDTMGWSGGVTSFEVIACGLPIVTLPGNFMRGRHSSAILTQIGVDETIALDPADYVDIAVRLGLDRQWKQSILARMRRGRSQLYSDTRCIRALEDFYLCAVKEHPG